MPKPIELRIGKEWIEPTEPLATIGQALDRYGWAQGDVGVLVPPDEYERLVQIANLVEGLGRMALAEHETGPSRQ